MLENVPFVNRIVLELFGSYTSCFNRELSSVEFFVYITSSLPENGDRQRMFFHRGWKVLGRVEEWGGPGFVQAILGWEDVGGLDWCQIWTWFHGFEHVGWDNWGIRLLKVTVFKEQEPWLSEAQPQPQTRKHITIFSSSPYSLYTIVFLQHYSNVSLILRNIMYLLYVIRRSLYAIYYDQREFWETTV